VRVGRPYMFEVIARTAVGPSGTATVGSGALAEAGVPSDASMNQIVPRAIPATRTIRNPAMVGARSVTSLPLWRSRRLMPAACVHPSRRARPRELARHGVKRSARARASA
jgi:hypothetical protein